MKNKILKFYLFAFVLFSDFKLFAQDSPGHESDEENLEDEEQAPQAPISGKLIWLALTGILFAYYIYRRNRAVKA